jgi:hypothetical protein
MPEGSGVGAPRSSRRTRVSLAVASSVVIAVSVITLPRVPTPYGDLQLYASIARARQQFGIGVPTEMWNSPVAVDHIPFYGPVFFDLCAVTLTWFGVTLTSLRMASLLGAVMFVAAAAGLAREVDESPDRWLWVVALLMFAPELQTGISTGAMHMLAIGFLMLALYLFVRGLRFPTVGRIAHGLLSGGALALAALTTPRSYLFIAAFFAAGILMSLMSRRVRRDMRWPFAAAAIGLGVPWLMWIIASHGNPVRWARYMAFIFSHEDADVAILPTAVRDFSFSWTQIVTPAVAFLGGLLALNGMRRTWRSASAALPAATLALLTTFLAHLLTVVILNYPFANGEYVALPLFAVVVAMPVSAFGLNRRTLAMLVTLLVVIDAGLFAVRAVRTAATWRASDPAPIDAFIRQHVPEGSVVAGPEAPFFFPVERSGSWYRMARPESWAPWARWVPIIEPDSVHHASRLSTPTPIARFLVWRDDDEIPDNYLCARDRVAARFEPPANYLRLLGPLGHPLDRGYPAATLYRLPDGCPTGYDPAVAH